MRLTLEIDGVTTTVELPDEVIDAIKAIADRHGLTLEQALAQAAVNQKLLEDQIDDGGELLVKKGDKVREFEYA